MKEWLFWVTEYAVVVIDALALVIIVIGTVEAFIRVGLHVVFSPPSGEARRDAGLRYARWLIAGLTFQLAADIIETAVTTNWDAVGRLAAIAIIRTFLNYFLERDVSDLRQRQRAAAK